MQTLYSIFVSIHGVLWLLVILAGVVGLIKTVLSLIQRSAPVGLDLSIYRLYSILFSLQVLIGILLILLLVLRGLPALNLLHGVVMIIALGAAQGLGAGARRHSEDVAKLRALLLSYVVSLILIVIGLSVRTVG